MRSANGLLQISASDLSNHLACGHVTALDLAAVDGRLQVPYRHNAELEMLRERGDRHERAYLGHLESQGLRIAQLHGADESSEATITAMRDGVDVLYQAPPRDSGHEKLSPGGTTCMKSGCDPWSSASRSE